MLTRYKLIHVPDGGVDHLIDGDRVSINETLTDEQADKLAALGLPYFQPVNASTDGESQPKPAQSRQRTEGGQFAKASDK